jgi:tRNA-splicing endonuclease subunit sen54 N-term
VHVTLARGNHITSLGHSVPRHVQVPADAGPTNDLHSAFTTEKIQRRLELLPEEALYLIERGAMFCWKEHELFSDAQASRKNALEDMEGSPMSVQQAFVEMIGKEDLTLEKYQVTPHPFFHTLVTWNQLEYARIGLFLFKTTWVCRNKSQATNGCISYAPSLSFFAREK